MYQELKPSEGLNNLIDSFWVFSNEEASEEYKVLPDTCTDLIFDINQDHGFISGVMTSFQLVELVAESDLIGIRFKTENFGAISRIPLSETKNLRVNLSEIFSSKDLNKLRQLHDLESSDEKIKFLDNFISTTFKENYERVDRLDLSVAENIRSCKGNLNIGDLAKSNHLSLRQLERRFKSYTGLTLKQFTTIVRFNNAKEAIASHTETSLLEIAFDFGFFDHAHMNHEFNRISGNNPSCFR